MTKGRRHGTVRSKALERNDASLPLESGTDTRKRCLSTMVHSSSSTWAAKIHNAHVASGASVDTDTDAGAVVVATGAGTVSVAPVLALSL